MGREQRPYICCIDNVQKQSKNWALGTPKGAWTQADLEEPNVTQFVRSERKEQSHSCGFIRPKDVERRWRRILWSTESNAELTSKRANRETTYQLVFLEIAYSSWQCTSATKTTAELKHFYTDSASLFTAVLTWTLNRNLSPHGFATFSIESLL